MTRAIVVNFRKYTPFGDEFYKPILEYFLKTMEKYNDEFDTLYLLDSQWNIAPEDVMGKKLKKVEHIDLNSSVRYYDAYKEMIPKIKEDLVLFMDNDMIIYKKGIIQRTLDLLGYKMDESEEVINKPIRSNIDVVTIIDEIGTYETNKLKNGNKFCPYWFASRTELLKKYLDIDWGSHMPHSETLGLLTEAMLKDNVSIFEWEEDKNSIYFDGAKEGDKGKDLGYYHIRAGSTPAYLLATKKYGDIKTYNDYLSNQPKRELLRQCAWYQYMGGNPQTIIQDLDINLDDWVTYMDKFKGYHGL